MYELKKIGNVLTSKSVRTGPSTYEKKNLPDRGLTTVEKHWYTASVIITLCRWPSGAQVERGLCTGLPPTGVMIPDAVLYNFDLLMMST